MSKNIKQRVVVTGLGAITPVGHTATESWENLVKGRSGVDRLTLFKADHLPVHIASEVKGFDPYRYITKKEAKRMARCSQFAITAAVEALEDAGLSYPFIAGDGEAAERSGVILGSSMGNFDKAEQGFKEYLRGLNKVTPFSLTASAPNLSTFHLCLKFNIQGYTNTISTSCSSGTVAIAEAVEVIKRGRCDIMLAGGAEANINEVTFIGFIAVRALSTRNDEPSLASRPFDADRDGFVLGEGAAFLVLENLEHALARKAHIYAEILGSANSSDTYHIIAPDPEAKGAVRSMRWALRDAGLEPADVDYINAHAASTPLGDAAETYAIKSVFNERAYQIPVSSTKSMLGHSFGATGAIEAVVCVKTIETGTIHPTINYTTPDPTCDLDYLPNHARHNATVNVVLTNSFGLGGQNATLIFERY